MTVLLSEEVRREKAGDQARSYATDVIVSRVASYAEWLFDHCVERKVVQLGYVPTHDAVALADMIEAADVPTLVALQMYPSSPVAAAASHELRCRWIEYSSDQIDDLAEQMRGQVEEDLRSPE